MSVGISSECQKFLSTHYSNDSGVVKEHNLIFNVFSQLYVRELYTRYLGYVYSIYSPLTVFQ